MLGQCFDGFLIRVLGTGFLSHTLELPRQGGAVIILQDDQVQGGVPFAVLSLWFVCLVGEGFIFRRIGGRRFSPDFFPAFGAGT